ncbi:hypothetical protein [Chromatocurvus halotolerans]|nr:hypothetical protein [Chromatocurvus halotolerans]
MTLLIALPEPATAQTATPENERDPLWTLLEDIDANVQRLLSGPRTPAVFTTLERCEGESPRRHLADALDSEASLQDADQGFRLNGFYTGNDIVNEDGNPGRGFVELSWELLNGGYVGNNRQADLLRSRAEMETLLAEEETRSQTLRCQRDRVHGLFAPLRLDIQSLLLRLMAPVHAYERRAYFQGWSHLDELLVSERDLLLAQREIDYLSSIVREGSVGLPPVIDIDMPALMDAIERDNRFQRARELSDDISRARYDAAQQNRLRVFLRQEVDGSGNPDDVVAGLRFSVPLGAPRTVALEERRRYNAASASLASAERSAIVRSAYLEVREQLQRVIDAYYAVSRAAERARRSLAEYRLHGEGSLPVAITRVKSLLQSADTAASGQEVLYRRIFETLAHARVPFDDKFLQFVPLTPELRARSGHRALYLWSGDFNGAPNEVLLDLAAAKRLDRFSISAGRQTDLEKLRALLAQQARPEVELLMGDVAWLDPDAFPRTRDRILNTLEAAGVTRDMALHLDVEPQQHPDYSRDRDTLIDEYLALIGGIRKALPQDMPLRLSLPAHWPESRYAELALIADELSIMAYGQSREAGIGKAMMLAQTIPGHKLRWVLRASDFPNELALESHMRDLQRLVGIERFAVHGYDDWLALGSAD